MRPLSFPTLLFYFFALACHFASGQEPENQEAEQIEIARKFIDRMFADPDKEAWHDFQLSEGMKSYLPSDTFQTWAKKIVDGYGKPGAPEKIEVVQRKDGRHDVSLYCRCLR